MSNEELKLAQELGLATYLSAYIWLMGEELEVKELDNEGVNAMAGFMVEPLNIATELVFRKLMGDEKGMAETILRLRAAIDTLPPPP